MSPREVIVQRTWPETDTLTGAFLDAPIEVRADHTRPGQVVAVEDLHGGKVYLALASAPGDPQLELLVAAPAVERIALGAGRSLRLEGPMGPGFPFEQALGRDVLLFAVGSALAPIKPLVELIRRNRAEYGQVTLYVGALHDDAFAYRERYDAWMRDRVDVVRVRDPEWVQHAFAADPLPVEDAVAYVCGMNAMMDDVTEVLGRHGLSPERVHRNW